ncbi:TPA: hypothetical protein ACN983_004684 [Vibrio parahaemolyticus]
MKILYIDILSLFYSQQYIHSDNSISQAYENWRCGSPVNLLKVVTPDLTGVERLRRAAVESGFKLYPLGTKYSRTLLIEVGLFNADELAPDVMLSIRMDDSDPVRRMIAHAHALNASWYVCGDSDSELLEAYPERYLTSTFGLGVTPELISKVRALS